MGSFLVAQPLSLDRKIQKELILATSDRTMAQVLILCYLAHLPPSLIGYHEISHHCALCLSLVNSKILHASRTFKKIKMGTTILGANTIGNSKMKMKPGSLIK